MHDLMLHFRYKLIPLFLIFDRFCIIKKQYTRNKKNFNLRGMVKTYPAKNMSKNQDPGSRNMSRAFSNIECFVRRAGMQANNSMFDVKNINLAGSWIYKK